MEVAAKLRDLKYSMKIVETFLVLRRLMSFVETPRGLKCLMRSAVSRCGLNSETRFVLMFSGAREVDDGNCFCELALCEATCCYSVWTFHLCQSIHDVLREERVVVVVVVVAVAEVAVIDCEFSWIFLNSCALC